jgi:hypothetical protein
VERRWRTAPLRIASPTPPQSSTGDFDSDIRRRRCFAKYSS